MGLEEDAVDLFEVDDASLVTDGFEQGAQAEVASAAQETIARTDDEGQRFGGEGVVTQTGPVHLGQKELFDNLGRQAREDDGIGDAGTDLLVDGQGQGLHELGLADEDEVVGGRKVLEEQAQTTEALRRHEVRVINDRHEELVGAMDLEGFLDEESFTAMVVAVELELKSLAEDAQGVVVGVEGAVDDRSDHALGVVVEQGLLKHGFPGAGFSQDEAQAALLGVNTENVEGLLLMG